MRQLTLLMTEKLLYREAKQLASVLYSHWWSGLNLQMVFSPPRFSFHSLVTDFSCFTNEYLLPWIHLMAQGMPLSVLPQPFHSLLLLPGQRRQQLGQSNMTLAENQWIVVPQASCHTGWGSLSLHKVLHLLCSWVTKEALLSARFVCGVGRLVFIRSTAPWVKAVKCWPCPQVGVLHHSDNTVSFGHFAGNWKHRYFG